MARLAAFSQLDASDAAARAAALKEQEAVRQISLAEMTDAMTADVNAWVSAAPQGQPIPSFAQAPPEVRQRMVERTQGRIPLMAIADLYDNTVRAATGDFAVGIPQGLAPASTTLSPTGQRQIGFEAPKNDRDHKPTQNESVARELHSLMANATGDLAALEKEGFDPGASVGYVADKLPKVMQSDERQSYQSAREQWIQAASHRLTGAGMTTQEAQKKAQAFFPAPGSGAREIKQKRKARAAFEAEVAQTAGVPPAAPAAPAPTSSPAAGLPTISSQKEFAALPPGTRFLGPDGRVYRKP